MALSKMRQAARTLLTEDEVSRDKLLLPGFLPYTKLITYSLDPQTSVG